jgi:hypothetical protein
MPDGSSADLHWQKHDRSTGGRTTLALLCALLLVSACATPPRTTPAERLAWYRANAGDPVDSFQSNARLWGWRSIGDSALTAWTRRDQGFLLELAHPCPDMPFAPSIGLTTRNDRVVAGLDSVVVPGRGAEGGPVSCRIQTIRPINTQVVKEHKRDLHDLDVVNRDPAVPDEPR